MTADKAHIELHDLNPQGLLHKLPQTEHRLRYRGPAAEDSISIHESEKVKLLDMDPLRDEADRVDLLTFYDLHQETKRTTSIHTQEETTKTGKESKRPKNPFDSPSKWNFLVGYLRAAYYVCAVNSAFGLAVSLFYPYSQKELEWWSGVHGQYRVAAYQISGWVQASFLALITLIVMADSIATRTFRWKEYGELTHTQTDATSFVFFICPSRWTLRTACSLVMATVPSLRALQIMALEEFSPHDHTWHFALSLVGLFASTLGVLLNLCPGHRVPWLRDSFHLVHVEDKGDIWTKVPIRQQTPGEIHYAPKLNGELRSKAKETKSRHFSSRPDHQNFKNVKDVYFGVTKIMYFGTFLSSFILHCIGLIMEPPDTQEVTAWMMLTSFAACSILNLGAVIFITYRAFTYCELPKRTPFLAKLLAPFCLSTSVRSVLELQPTEDSSVSLVTLQTVVTYLYLYLLAVLFLTFLLEVVLETCLWGRLCQALGKFLWRNMREDGVNKKTVRFFDTVGSMAALTGLVLGLCSIFIDQYDLEVEPKGFAADVKRVCEEFQLSIKPVTSFLKSLIEELDKHFGCEEVFQVLGPTATITLFANFFPGAGSIASLGSRSAYYGVRVANAMTNLSAKLLKSKNLLWQVSKAVYMVQKLFFGNLSKIIKLSSGGQIAKVLPFLPPVVLGIYVFFGVFWPKRILFFSAKQRRKTMCSNLTQWILVLILLIVAILVNTAMVDELIDLLNENLPIVTINAKRKLGWELSMAASAFSLLSVLTYIISSLILWHQTDKNHENITNWEKDWQAELDKREMVTIRTAIGNKYEKKTKIQYKKERIGPWTWVLPISLCLMSCGFGVLANLNPKLEFSLEPRGKLGQIIDRVTDRLDFYEEDMYVVKNDTEKECLPYTSFSDMAKDKGFDTILMRPVNKFYNKTEELVKPLRDVLRGVRSQLLLEVGEDLFGVDLNNVWKANKLQYLGMLFLVPRVICLLILMFGFLAAGCFVCCMQIFQLIEPKNIVSAYGKVAMFSVIYVLGFQFALHNILTTFGIPFYHIKVRFGLGFIYDLVADSILVSVYVGMKNEYFFAIPRRKTMVTYSVPGVSDDGPNITGQII